MFTKIIGAENKTFIFKEKFRITPVKDWIIYLVLAICFAGSSFLRVWWILLEYTFNNDRSFTTFLPSFLALFINIIYFAMVVYIFFLLYLRLKKIEEKARIRCYFIIISLIPLNELVTINNGISFEQLFIMAGDNNNLRMVIVAILIVTIGWGIYALIKWNKIISHVVAKALILICPVGFILSIFLQAVQFSNHSHKLKTIEQSTKQSPVVLIVFDELDERLAFSERPYTVLLPEFDHLRNESVYATNAYPPAKYTMFSIPALLTGRVEEDLNKTEKIYAQFIKSAKHKRMQLWQYNPNIFSIIDGMGLTSQAIAWQEEYPEVANTSLSLHQRMVEQWGMVFRNNPLLKYAWLIHPPIWFERTSEYHHNTYLNVLHETKVALDDRNASFIFLHQPIPHPPGIYNRFTKEFADGGDSSYLDNLALADRTLGEIRKMMEGNGIWDKSTVIVTGDHWWRDDHWSRSPAWTKEEDDVSFKDKSDHKAIRRVPYLVKLPYQRSGINFDAKMNTIITHDLILALVCGQIVDYQALTDWLIRNESGLETYNSDKYN